MLKILVFPTLAAFAAAVSMMGGAAAAAPEWNPAARHAVPLGPEAHRLVVGFRATPSNTVVQSVRRTARAQSFEIATAQTSDADVASLARRAGIPWRGRDA